MSSHGFEFLNFVINGLSGKPVLGEGWGKNSQGPPIPPILKTQPHLLYELRLRYIEDSMVFCSSVASSSSIVTFSSVSTISTPCRIRYMFTQYSVWQLISRQRFSLLVIHSNYSLILAWSSYLSAPKCTQISIRIDRFLFSSFLTFKMNRPTELTVEWLPSLLRLCF